MNLAKQVNKKLEEILNIRAEIDRMNKDLGNNETLTNIQTGEEQTKEDALNLVNEILDQIKFDLNKITNDGQNVNDLFTNIYYVNDFMQDKEVSKQKPLAPGFSNPPEINNFNIDTKPNKKYPNNWNYFDGE